MNIKDQNSNLIDDVIHPKLIFFEHVRLIEALLFASSKPINRASLQDRLPPDIPIDQIIDELRETYANRGVNIVNVANSVAFRTATDLSDQLRMSVSVKKRLSPAAVETIAIIAYHQPVTRGDIESIRGVAVSKGILDTLLEAGWIRPRGRRNVPGRPLQWGTTDGFLDHFGMENLIDLPGLEELKTAGLLEKRQSLTSLILPDDILENDEEEADDEQNELFGITEESEKERLSEN
jgi:segregation and condensation protein B